MRAQLAMDVFLSDTRGQRRLTPLLLMCALLGIIAADCPKPEAGENMVPTTDTLLKNDFPDGSDATLECGNGYVKESGSGILTCLDEKWTEPDLICKKKDCGVPKSQPNMQFHIPNGTLFGDIIQVFCDEGYQISGASYKHCFASGWFGSAQCSIVHCGKPSQVPNGRSSWNSEESPTYNKVISYSCDEGYALSGHDSIVCSKTGEYDSQPPECKSVATEDKMTTKMVTSAPTSTQPETLSSVASPTTPAAHRDAAVTASAPAAASTSEQGTAMSPGTFRHSVLKHGYIARTPHAGARYLMAAEGKAATTSVTSALSSSFGDENTENTENTEIMITNKNNADAALTLTVVLVTLVAVGIVIGLFLYKFQRRRKGSYDTREDLKPELLQFQNL